jgi:hypothetical protein
MTKKSQNHMLLELLQKGPTTALDVFKKTGSMCAAERVRDLRELGFNIKTEMVTNANGKRFAMYCLLTKKRKAA